MKLKSIMGNVLELLLQRALELSGRCDILVLLNAEQKKQMEGRYFADGGIILNISPTAIRNYTATEDGIEFDVRFDGVDQHIKLSYYQIMGVKDYSMPESLNGTPLSPWVPISLLWENMMARDEYVHVMENANGRYEVPLAPVETVNKPLPGGLRVVK